jgi:3',5'-nucleoside bisphosphate phosphatase
MRAYRADLHIHTVLSACAEIEMIPPLIVEEALLKGLDIIAITDHNATANAMAVREAAAEIQGPDGTGLIVLLGMELQTREEVDLLCIFDTPEALAAWQEVVDAQILPLPNDPDHFGPQYVVDREGNLVSEEQRLLQTPTMIGLEEAARQVHALGGLAIPAHIDRKYNGLMPVLGLWPTELEVDAAEVSPNMRPSRAREAYTSIPSHVALISNSDAHWLDWIGHVMTIYELEDEPSIESLRQCLRGEGHRRAYVP